jgi:glycosyltransferase involved in cell wall biosynthesis
MTDVVFVLPDKLGGVTSLNAGLIGHRDRTRFAARSIATHNRLDPDARWSEALGADRDEVLEYAYPDENLYTVLRRLQEAVGDANGVLVSNDWPELTMAAAFGTAKTVYQIVHDEYNLRLAVEWQEVVDVFIAHSRFIYDRLLEELPARRDRIFHVRYGIPLPAVGRTAAAGPLRLLFVGRMTEGKGILDLPEIDRLLREAGVPVTWTVIGKGPRKEDLRAAWGSAEHVRFEEPATGAEVAAISAAHDVFVLPTRFEGFPVSLLEAMSVGLVPVVSDLPGGIAEMVSANTGFRPSAGDVAGFAAAIGELHADRERLERMSAAASDAVRRDFDIRARVRDYEGLFERWRELRVDRPGRRAVKVGSRLDQPWLPNAVVRLARSLTPAR